MIDWTYSHFRVLMRLMAPEALLYTEMHTTGAIHYKTTQILQHGFIEKPLALQLGGADKQALVTCAKIAEDYQFAEINLNLGCPSDKVQAGRFGACLMTEAEHVADCISAMKQAVSIPITAKTRLGIDDYDSYEFFSNFAYKLVEAGCDKLIIHARKAWLKGLSPKQNRTIPPLHYDFAYRLKETLPKIPVVINGNISTVEDIHQHMQWVDGVMIGRLVCNNPYQLTQLNHYFYPDHSIKSRSEIFHSYLNYILEKWEAGVSLSLLLKPVLNFAFGLPNAKQWKDYLLIAQQSKKIESLALAYTWLQDNEYCLAPLNDTVSF